MARNNLQIKVGSYSGNGADNRNIVGIGHRPSLLIVKGASNNAVFRTRYHRLDTTGHLAAGTADQADRIQEFLADGFQLGANADVNATGVDYYYLSIRGAAGQKHCRSGRYIGNGADNRNYTTGGLGFTPNLVVVKASTTADAAIWKSSSMSGEDAAAFALTANGSNRIQNLQSNGFQLGTSALTNAAGVAYNFFALKELAGAIKVGTYTGDGLDNRQITGIGFAPDFVLVKCSTAAARAWFRATGMAADTSYSLGAEAPKAGVIKTLGTDGFTVGTDVAANGSAVIYHYLAIKSGSFNAPVERAVA